MMNNIFAKKNAPFKTLIFFSVGLRNFPLNIFVQAHTLIFF